VAPVFVLAFGAGCYLSFMKVYNLRCEHDHRFEGWFSSEQDCTAQLSSASLACPLCDSTAVQRLPSAPHIGKAASAESPPPSQQQILTLMRQMIAQGEDVGMRFVEEARRMHRDEIPARPIRGTVSPEEGAALLEEDIGVLPIPSALKEPLQ